MSAASFYRKCNRFACGKTHSQNAVRHRCVLVSRCFVLKILILQEVSPGQLRGNFQRNLRGRLVYCAFHFVGGAVLCQLAVGVVLCLLFGCICLFSWRLLPLLVWLPPLLLRLSPGRLLLLPFPLRPGRRPLLPGRLLRRLFRRLLRPVWLCPPLRRLRRRLWPLYPLRPVRWLRPCSPCRRSAGPVRRQLGGLPPILSQLFLWRRFWKLPC